MKTILHKSDTRGYANHGWLETYHSFSFADYYDRERIHFGALRVLNDDIVAGGQGFGMHPHDNMEIITIPLEGDLEH
ncbi:MAG TPA: pirin family protein, partial [Bacteroidales bacterium]|nr:pirin family protein [Bacteroidales bacterium]